MNPNSKRHLLSDDTLALAVRDGEDGAFDELVRRHQQRVYGVAYRMTGSREEALDVTQDALIKAYRKIHTWQPSGSFVSWLLRITTNQSIDHLRKHKRHRIAEPLDEGFRTNDGKDVKSSPIVQTESRVRGREIENRIQSALGVLSPSQRTVFVLRHYEGKALKEIAPIMGCTVGTVKVHLFRALQKLRGELGDLFDT